MINYNEKFAKLGTKIMDALKAQKLLSKTSFDEEIEWTWFYLWHHEGRRARHGASMMAPDYAHWHGMFEVAERFYQELIPQAREIAHHAEEEGKTDEAKVVLDIIQDILDRPEHEWFEAAKKLEAEGKASVLPGSPDLADGSHKADADSDESKAAATPDTATANAD